MEEEDAAAAAITLDVVVARRWKAGRNPSAERT